MGSQSGIVGKSDLVSVSLVPAGWFAVLVAVPTSWLVQYGPALNAPLQMKGTSLLAHA